MAGRQLPPGQFSFPPARGGQDAVGARNSGEIQWAVHYRKQNAVTREEAFPLPNIADNLSSLSASKGSSALDGADVPFGLANAPAAYSRLVAKANRHLPPSEVVCYLGNTVLHPAGAWGQLRILRKVLSAFGAARLQVSQEKAQLFRDHLKYLDHEVSTQRIMIPPENTAVIREWPLLNMRKALRALLGKCEYYRRFIADDATLLAPLVWYTQRKQHDRIPIRDKDFDALDAFRLM